MALTSKFCSVFKNDCHFALIVLFPAYDLVAPKSQDNLTNAKLLLRDRGEGGWGKDVCKGLASYSHVGEVTIPLVA